MLIALESILFVLFSVHLCISASSAQSSEGLFSVLVTPSLTLGLDSQARKWNRLNLFVGGCVQGSYDDCTVIGDEVLIMTMTTLSMAMTCVTLPFYTWPIVVHQMGVKLSMGWVGSWVHKFTWQWVGLGQLFRELVWIWVDEMDPQRTLISLIRLMWKQLKERAVLCCFR